MALAFYSYGGYVDVPFEVWDIDNNSQLMVSFRDQGDDGAFNLISQRTSGPRDSQSREYIIVHDLPYDAGSPHSNLSRRGGLRSRLMYFMWPILASGAQWDAASLPESELRVVASNTTALGHTASLHRQNESVHVDHHSLQMIPVDRSTGYTESSTPMMVGWRIQQTVAER